MKELAHLQYLPFTYLNPYLDPPELASSEVVADFYFFIVSIDYRTSTPEGHFEGKIDRNFFHGADLLYALAIQKLKENPDFFTAKYFQQISDDEVINWLSITKNGKRVIIYHPQERAELLRDSGKNLLKLGFNSSLELVQRCEGYLIREDGNGLLQILKDFKAYSDPVSKKSYLWIKFLTGRGVLDIQDLENLNLPVDNHLTRIALRTGILEIKDEDIKSRLREEKPFTLSEDLKLREAIRIAFKELLKNKKFNFRDLDDFFWVLGRTHCIHSKNPLCENYLHHSTCQLMVELKINCKQKCPLAPCCKGFRDEEYRELFEPNIRTFFY
ncbi:MAG: hypothetical protein HWN66_15905 [Candidatus Helarchaeota archaeon]|nr:hypothetical protein [Candidatus Helarchaeota archaeon]